MNTNTRRDKILEILKGAHAPISAGVLAKQLHVSRQIIVGDVALLRASGEDISSTARGYLYQAFHKEEESFGYVGLILCRHADDALRQELYCVVDYGGCLIDVLIDHPLYGQITGILDIRSRYDADQFADRVEKGEGSPLSALTDGLHLHHIGCRDEKAFRLILSALKKEGILAEQPSR